MWFYSIPRSTKVADISIHNVQRCFAVFQKVLECMIGMLSCNSNICIDAVLTCTVLAHNFASIDNRCKVMGQLSTC